MDSLTQIVLGGAVGEAVLGKKVGNKAVLWGALAGTIPDLDVLTKYFVDEIRANELHRGFSHSLFFCIIAAPILGWMVNKIYEKKGEANWKDWSKLFFWSLVTHPLLDIHTTWGTQFLWPLETKFSYKNIFVVDPLYTIPFMVFLIMAMLQNITSEKRRKYNWLGIYISSGYMVLTLLLKAYTFQKFTISLDKQGIKYTEIETKPTPLNSILWTANVKTNDAFLIGYYSIFDSKEEITFEYYPKNYYLIQNIKNDQILLRLKKLSQGWFTIEKEDSNLYFNDLRFGRMGNNESGSFVFRYVLEEKNGELVARQEQPKIKDVRPILNTLFHRILGN